MSKIQLLIYMVFQSILAISQECNDTVVYTDCSGTLKPIGENSYDSNQACDFLVQNPDSTGRIQLDLDIRGLELFADYITIYDGPDANSPVLLETFSENRTKFSVLSISNEVFIEFRSNDTIEGLGWNISYQCISNNGNNIAVKYPFFITPTANENIFETNLEIQNNGLNDLENLNYYYVFSYDLFVDSADIIYPIDFSIQDLASGATQIINNVIDINNSNLGLASGQYFIGVLFDEVSDEISIDDNFQFDDVLTVGFPTCTDTTFFTACSGAFTDGSNDLKYTSDLDCSYLISVPKGNSIEFSLDYFETESGFDFITIFDGETTSSPILDKLSGVSTEILTYTSSSNHLLVKFTTDAVLNYSGFNASYTCTNPILNLKLNELLISKLQTDTSLLVIEAEVQNEYSEILSDVSLSLLLFDSNRVNYNPITLALENRIDLNPNSTSLFLDTIQLDLVESLLENSPNGNYAIGLGLNLDSTISEATYSDNIQYSMEVFEVNKCPFPFEFDSCSVFLTDVDIDGKAMFNLNCATTLFNKSDQLFQISIQNFNYSDGVDFLSIQKGDALSIDTLYQFNSAITDSVFIIEADTITFYVNTNGRNSSEPFQISVDCITKSEEINLGFQEILLGGINTNDSTLDYSFLVSNLSNTNLGSTEVRIVSSDDNLFDESDQTILDTIIYDLESNAEFNFFKSWKVNQSGSYYLIGEVDPFNKIDEIDEGDNIFISDEFSVLLNNNLQAEIPSKAVLYKSNGYLNIYHPTDRIHSIQIFNLSGQQVLSKFNSEQLKTIAIPLAKLTTGAYVVRLIINNGTTQTTLITN